MSRPVVALLLVGAALAGCAQPDPREPWAAPWKKVGKSAAEGDRREGAGPAEVISQEAGDAEPGSEVGPCSWSRPIIPVKASDGIGQPGTQAR
jgi:hypothetical protein